MGGFSSQIFGQGQSQGQSQAFSEAKKKRTEDKAHRRQKKLDAVAKDQASSSADDKDRKKRIVGSNPNITSNQGRLGSANVGRRRLSV